MIINILSVLLGYLIGSFLPAYIFGRMKGFDIRQVGQKNADTANTYFTIGLYAAIPTGLIDLSKGLLAMWVALKLGVSFQIAQLAGFSAILGHVFPFYLEFKGGQGVATSLGMLFYYLYNYIRIGAITIPDIFFLLIVVILIWFSAREGPAMGIVILPVFCYSIVKNVPHFFINPFFISIIGYILGINIYNTIERKLFKITDEEVKRHLWRIILRPFAVLFILYYSKTDKPSTLILVGSVLLPFLFLDIIRLILKKKSLPIHFLFKKKENKTFSSMTMFLISIFSVILLFSYEISILSILFLIFGDMFSKFFGLSFGKHKIWGKTIEGSAAHLAGSLIAGYIGMGFLRYPVYYLPIGAFTASLVELLPLGIDDNFTVGILSGTGMKIAKILLH